jgi:hypothetical protein
LFLPLAESVGIREFLDAPENTSAESETGTGGKNNLTKTL